MSESQTGTVTYMEGALALQAAWAPELRKAAEQHYGRTELAAEAISLVSIRGFESPRTVSLRLRQQQLLLELGGY